MKKKKFLITGGTGFLGSNLINLISKKKNYLLFLLRRKNSDIYKIKNKNIIKFINIEENNLEIIFKRNKFDLIIHCATNYGAEKKGHKKITYANLTLPVNLLKLAKKYRVKFFINIDTVLNKSISAYSLSKNKFFNKLKFFSNYFYCCNIKLEHFYGPGDNTKKFIPNVICELLKFKRKIDFTKGDQKRDFIYIDDVVNALKKIIIYILHKKNTRPKLENFYVGTGKKIKIKSIVLLIAKILNNRTTKLNFGKIPSRKNEVSINKVGLYKTKRLGWKNSTKLNLGLKKTVNYYKKFIK
jgi:nucleoside-diphosphate-sugar epimerase